MTWLPGTTYCGRNGSPPCVYLGRIGAHRVKYRVHGQDRELTCSVSAWTRTMLPIPHSEIAA